eukprot:EG_transcript_9842
MLEWEGFFLDQEISSPSLLETNHIAASQQCKDVQLLMEDANLMETAFLAPIRGGAQLQPLLQSPSGHLCHLALDCLEAFQHNVLVKEMPSFKELQKCVGSKLAAEGVLSSLSSLCPDRRINNQFHWICLCIIACVPTPDNLDLLTNHLQISGLDTAASQHLEYFNGALESIDLDLFCLWKTHAVVNENNVLGRFRSWHFILTPSHMRLREALVSSGERHPSLQPTEVVFRCMWIILGQYTTEMTYAGVQQACPRVSTGDWDRLHVLVASLASAAEKMNVLRQLFWNNEKQEWNSAVRKVYQKLSVDEGKAKKRGRSTAGNTADPGVNAKRNARPPAQKANACKTTFWCGDQPQQVTFPLLKALTPDQGADIVTIVGHHFSASCQVKCHLVGKPTRWETFGLLQPNTLKSIGTGCCTIDVAHVVVNQDVFPDAVGEVEVVVFVVVLDKHGDDVHHPQQLSVGNPIFRFLRPVGQNNGSFLGQHVPVSQGPVFPLDLSLFSDAPSASSSA